MSGGTSCKCSTERRAWYVLQRRCNHSKFNGGLHTPSAYSEVRCAACGKRWRTRAAYVERLPDAPSAHDILDAARSGGDNVRALCSGLTDDALRFENDAHGQAVDRATMAGENNSAIAHHQARNALEAELVRRGHAAPFSGGVIPEHDCDASNCVNVSGTCEKVSPDA